MVGDMPLMTGCQREIPKMKLAWDCQYHGEKEVHVGSLGWVGCM